MSAIRVRRLLFLLALACAGGCRAPSWAVGEQDDPRQRLRDSEAQRDWDPQTYRDAIDQRARNEADFLARNPGGRR